MAMIKKSAKSAPKMMKPVAPAKKGIPAPPAMASNPMGAAGPMMKKGGKMKKAEKGGSFPDLNKDGKITKADILKGRGVIAKKGAKMKK